MRGKYQKILFRFLAVLTAFLVIFSHLVIPSYAQDSVTSGMRSCAADPVCRVTLISEAKSLGVASKVVPISQNMGLKLLQGGGGQTASSVALSPAGTVGGGNVAKIIIAGIPIIGGALAAFFFGVAQIENLQREAAEAYCLANPTDGYCSSTAIVVRNPKSGGSYEFNGRQLLTPPLVHEGFLYGNVPTTGTPDLWRVKDSLGRDLDQIPVNDFNKDTYTGLQRAVEWENWSDAARRAAIDLVKDSFFKELLESLSPTNLIGSIPEGTSGLEISGAGFQLVPNSDGTYRLVPIGDPASFPIGDPLNDPNGDLDSDGVPNSSDPDIDGDGVPNNSDPDPYNRNVPNPNPSPNPSPSASPSPSPSPGASPGDVTGNVPFQPGASTFSKPNFITYAVTVFKQKFPLDVIGELPPNSASNQCPKVTFWKSDFEVCIIRDFLRMLKIPIIISFIIWAILTL